MGVYNPNLPQILGQEWVPIRDENIQFSGVTNSVELGHTFSPVVSTNLQEGRFYVNTLPPALMRNQVMTMSVYERGTEDRSGPVRSVIIPCNNGGITGSSTVVAFNNATTVQDAVFDPSDRRYIQLKLGFGLQADISMFFAVNQYASLLSGKRILGVNFLYAGEVTAPQLDDLGALTFLLPTIRNSVGGDIVEYPNLIAGSAPLLGGNRFIPGTVNRVFLGDTNAFFSPTTGLNASTAMPWTVTDLQRFEISATDRLQIHLFSPALAGQGPAWTLDYAAMEVVFCEEQRVAVGSSLFGFGSSTVSLQYRPGANIIALRNVDGTTPAVLSPLKEYTVALSQGNLGDSPLRFATVDRLSPEPTMNALRELYQIPSLEGVQVNIPSPPSPDINGQVFSTVQTHVLPQISLHTSGGPMNEVHVYGRQAVAQVFGNVLAAAQEVLDSGLSSAVYPWVRFYARRFGDTTAPLTLTSTTFPSSVVSITPGEWDVLDPIIDGWKEITLRFDTPPTMGTGTNPQWTWAAGTELIGNRWEVLGATAPALSGVPSGLFLMTLAPAPHQLGPATYGQPVSGAGINLTWLPQYAPPIGPPGTDDITSDGVLLFSQDQPAISGFTLTQLNQPLSGIGLNCGIAPQFVPTAIQYHQLTWTPDQTSVASDTFTRTVASGWGTATSGQTWTTSGGSATDYSVSGGSGNVLLSTANVTRASTLGTFSARNVDYSGQVWSSLAASGASQQSLFFMRQTTTSDYLYGQLRFFDIANRLVQFSLNTLVAGSLTVLGSVTIENLYVPNTPINVRFQVIGTDFRGKAWPATEAEPDWQLQVSTITNPLAGAVGVRTFSSTGSILGVTVSYDNLVISQIAEGYTELQRMDQVTGWATIMKATNMGVVSFNDYEARTGLLSSYRIRYVNVYEFAGPWSATVTTTLTAPGVTATSLTATDHVLIFTTNSVQAGTSNLAYSPGWEGDVEEGFNFPESAGQIYQTMYGRDFVTVFRPDERGGTNFSRTLLVQAAAISPETLEDFTSLRDMAWVDVPYICVRDEEGNRWFANVSVPSGVVLRDRRLYLAPVSIVEVTDTPTPVDP